MPRNRVTIVPVALITVPINTRKKEKAIVFPIPILRDNGPESGALKAKRRRGSVVSIPPSRAFISSSAISRDIKGPTVPIGERIEKDAKTMTAINALNFFSLFLTATLLH